MKCLVKNKVKVTVCVVTYNQEHYVGQCLQSLVDQETNFNFKIIVADDCSTDGTRAILRQFKESYPSLITLIFHDKNLGPYQNFLFIHSQANSEYIAHMDGDDFALPTKLQIQSDYLDANSNCNIIWHRMLVKNEGTGKLVEDLIDLSLVPKIGFSRGDVLRFLAVGLHSSKMYRAKARDFALPPFPVMDYFANVEQIGTGVANILPASPLGVYRVAVGIATSNNNSKRLQGQSLVFFSKKYPAFIREINTAALLLLLADLKNLRGTLWMHLWVWLVTFRLCAFLDLWKFRRIFKMLKLPSTTE